MEKPTRDVEIVRNKNDRFIHGKIHRHDSAICIVDLMNELVTKSKWKLRHDSFLNTCMCKVHLNSVNQRRDC